MDLVVTDHPLIAIGAHKELTFRNHLVFLGEGPAWSPYLSLYTYGRRIGETPIDFKYASATPEALNLLSSDWPGWTAQSSLHVLFIENMLRFTIVGKLPGAPFHYRKNYTLEAIGYDADFGITFFKLFDVRVIESTLMVKPHGI